ncbi:hypothetical protein JTE90_007846 [Oedothorax gibbosus]|uniref:Uncharacterized protein n=1 Tax=Oedothorax gibbosus TaxID=931172 RepID=A0AAV6VH70_9ARAC|nr:hypothetical protein JTE90_007846 [Oedothorax gibbosus]
MEKTFLLLSFVTACSALFFPFFNLQNGRQTMMNICIYSVDPAQYTPKCFLCPSTAYTSVLQTCVQRASIPSNVTYVQAQCIEQNCAINRVSRGRRSIDFSIPDSNSISSPSSASPSGGNLIISDGGRDANYTSDDLQGLLVVGEEETVAVDKDEEAQDEEVGDFGDLA